MTTARQPHVPAATILVAEDDAATAELLRLGLEARGHRVWVAASGAEARQLVREARPDLVICDLVLPDGNGLILCDDLGRESGAPVIVCSGSKRSDDRILALKLGADDFIGKPFEMTELQARVEAALRRAARSRALAEEEGAAAPAKDSPPPRTTVGPLVLDHGRCSVAVGGRPLALTPTEFRLLSALAERPNQVWRRSDLAERAWGQYDASLDRSLEVHLRRLRGKLKSAPGAPALVTIRGFGYRLAHEPSASAA